MEEGVGRRVYGGVSDSAGGEDKEYGWEMAEHCNFIEIPA